MANFKEYNNNTFYIGPSGTVEKHQSSFDILRVGYATYPFDKNNNGELIWFGLKQDNNFEGVLA